MDSVLLIAQSLIATGVAALARAKSLIDAFDKSTGFDAVELADDVQQLEAYADRLEKAIQARLGRAT